MEKRTHTSEESGWRIWWQLMRPHTLTASFVPVLIGTALALPVTEIHVPVFLAMLVASILIQSATNMFNEYFDFKRGLDTAESVGIGGAIVRHGITPRTVMAIAVGCCAAAVGLGIYICLVSSWWLAAIGSVCIATGYLYTGGPYPIAYSPFGEIVSGLFMGLVIIGISFFIQTGTVSDTAILTSVPVSILIGNILMANNIRDRVGDEKNGRRTLAILLGHKGAVRLLAGMFAAAYVWLVVLTLTEVVPPESLLALLSLPKAVQAVREFKGKTAPPEMMPAMKFTAQVNTFFGFLLAVGVFIGYSL
ncbi:1,4-dihydroxy-2-naphthoate polyprenyltransferase [Paludifilum halophilum]|uniref:1,4-dihydroxy-2-naphthoate octaprenyltransferase n=1 Tax=Paludifilum halophilum TaxID=1642702 RepID=A0A235B5C0_9BACL|nr:1,4-dihydroxy-2-naphthoate polyprenyltransferase [Paludifilum halophilum]OYD07097.1 1,4-dihydroxy-2-naphthoate octaprenyltransferase [Paludifilum halophilum]